MNPAPKPVLYFHTVKYLKWTQIRHRFTFRACHPKPDLSPAPEISANCRSEVVFPKMPCCYRGNDIFLFLNDKESFSGWNDENRDKLWLYNLHYFDWLRQPEISEEEGNRWIAKWVAENPPPAGNGWEPYTLSLRIVNWIKWHLSGHELAEEARHSLAVQVRYLRKRLEYHLLANHLLANAKALMFAGMFFDGDEAKQWLEKGIEIYRNQLPEQILPDGGHFELSPMYHSIILEDLLDLKNIDAPLDLDDIIERMAYWLSVMTGPDGTIALFNDAARGIALAPDVLRQYANSLGIKAKDFATPVLLRESGYARLSNGDLTLIVDCGEIGPSYQPGHAHADALSFEAWKGGRKVITNSGTGRYCNSPERQYQRSTAAHNTVAVDDRSSSQVWGAHRVGRRGHIVQKTIEGDFELKAAFENTDRIIHYRKWTLSDSKTIKIEDRFQGKDKKEFGISVYYHPIDKGISFSTCPPMEKEERDTPYSPEFGIFDKIRTIVFKMNIQSMETVETVISIQ